MKEIQVFQKNNFSIRTIEINNEPYFVAKDVAEILGYSETNRMTERLDADEKMSTKIVGISATNPNVTVISESGLYSAILGSNKPEAKAFKKWITAEVLPSIRKHGMYATDTTIENMISNPDFAIQLLQNLKEEKAKRLEAEKTKALISDRKTASAMATASNAIKKVKKLEAVLNKTTDYATIMAVENFTKEKYDHHLLKRHCVENELEIKKVIDTRYGSVNSYPKEAWAYVYNIDIKTIFPTA